MLLTNEVGGQSPTSVSAETVPSSTYIRQFIHFPSPHHTQLHQTFFPFFLSLLTHSLNYPIHFPFYSFWPFLTNQSTSLPSLLSNFLFVSFLLISKNDDVVVVLFRFPFSISLPRRNFIIN